MKISIITVCYNSAETIEDTINSVLNQSYQDIEYIIVDGASTDKTMELVNRYSSRISKVISEKDSGIYDAMNKGISLATGDVVGILNSDDVYASHEVIHKVADAFKREKAEGVYGDLVYINQGDTDKVIRYWKSGGYKEGSFKLGWMPPHPTFFVSKEKYQAWGMYNLSLKSAADYELMLRFIHKQGLKLVYIPEILVKMRVGGMSNENIFHRLRANREDKKAWEINRLKPGVLTFLFKPLRKIDQYFSKPK
jgi:glycosyltransferase involved in cell wall biosynthesis